MKKMKSLFSFKRKKISLKSLSFPQCSSRPKSKIRLTKRRSAVSSKKRSDEADEIPISKVRIAKLLTVMFSLRKQPKEVDTDNSTERERVVVSTDAARVSVCDEGPAGDPVLSSATSTDDDSGDDVAVKEGVAVEEGEDSYRSFESCLVEMIVGEGGLSELVDVEELLCCWKNLRSPVFVDLVSRYYEDVCRDLFAPLAEDAIVVVCDGPVISSL